MYLVAARMEDAAYAGDIKGADIGAGYYGGAGAFHVWPNTAWSLLPNRRLPIWVPPQGPKNGTGDGQEAVTALQDLGVPSGCYSALDMETMVDRTYVDEFQEVMQEAGYPVWVYGSLSTVFRNPRCNGYWVADYSLTPLGVRDLLETPGVRGVQYAANIAPGYDLSSIHQWTEFLMWQG